MAGGQTSTLDHVKTGQTHHKRQRAEQCRQWTVSAWTLCLLLFTTGLLEEVAAGCIYLPSFDMRSACAASKVGEGASRHLRG